MYTFKILQTKKFAMYKLYRISQKVFVTDWFTIFNYLVALNFICEHASYKLVCITQGCQIENWNVWGNSTIL